LWEGVGVCSYLLVHFWYTRVAAVKSAMNAMFTNRVGDYFLTIGFFVIFFTFGTLDYATVFSLAPYINTNVITFIAILLLLGAAAKSAQLGLHIWLPMAMEGPTPVSALIHAERSGLLKIIFNRIYIICIDIFLNLFFVYKIICRIYLIKSSETLYIIYFLQIIKTKSIHYYEIFNDKCLFFSLIKGKELKTSLFYHSHSISTKANILNNYKKENNKFFENIYDLNPYWITGYSDGEAAFMFSIRRNKKYKLGWYFRPTYQIGVHESDIFVLYRIKKFFLNVGSIRKVGKYYYYIVDSLKDIQNIIIPHFNEYLLLSINKYTSFYLLKSCVEVISENPNLNNEQFLELLKYKASFKQGLNVKIFEEYKDIKPFNIKEITYPLENNITPDWLSGFVAGDGTFGVYRRGGKYKNYNCAFRISQNKIDEPLLKRISYFLTCGKIIKNKSGMRDLGVFSISDLNTKIIPLFKKHKLCTSKEIDFQYFCEIVDIFNKKGKNKRWLKEDVIKIGVIALKMNNFRRNVK